MRADIDRGHTLFDNQNVNENSNLTVNGLATKVTWKSEVSQSVLTPKVGWLSLGRDGRSMEIAVGILMPSESEFAISGDPSSVSGLSDQEYESKRRDEASDVRSYVNSNTILLQFKYLFYFDLF